MRLAQRKEQGQRALLVANESFYLRERSEHVLAMKKARTINRARRGPRDGRTDARTPVTVDVPRASEARRQKPGSRGGVGREKQEHRRTAHIHRRPGLFLHAVVAVGVWATV